MCTLTLALWSGKEKSLKKNFSAGRLITKPALGLWSDMWSLELTLIMINSHKDYESGLWLGQHCCTQIQWLPTGNSVSIPWLSQTQSPALPDPRRSTTGWLWLFSRPLPSFPFPHRDQQTAIYALTQHFHVPAICLLRCLLACLNHSTNIPWAWSMCPHGVSPPQRAGIWDGHLRSPENWGGSPVLLHLIRFKTVPLMHKLDSGCILRKSPAFSQPPGFWPLSLLPGKYFFLYPFCRRMLSSRVGWVLSLGGKRRAPRNSALENSYWIHPQRTRAQFLSLGNLQGQ